jgi:hypothetical protein
MVVTGDIPHEDANLAVVDLASVTTPLSLHPHGVRAALGEATGIEGDDTIGFAQPLGYLANQHRHQRPVVPRRGTDKVLDDLSLDIDPRRNFLGILPL